MSDHECYRLIFFINPVKLSEYVPGHDGAGFLAACQWAQQTDSSAWSHADNVLNGHLNGARGSSILRLLLRIGE